MCTVCGCETHDGAHTHVLPDGTVVTHSHGVHTPAQGHAHAHGHVGHGHDHGHAHGHGRAHDHGDVHARASGDAHAQARMIQVERDILSKNAEFAARNRRRFAERGLTALNLMSSPGSGKTSLLVRSLADLKTRFPVGVIEGDQQTSLDADRIRAAGAPAIQINTGKACHLDAEMVGFALDGLAVAPGGVVFVENVGNLVCPAAFDLGEAAKIVLASTTEGEEKPLKYPEMFAAADLLIVSKIDLVPHLGFDVEALVANARKVNPRLQTVRVSARSGEGLEDWYGWIQTRRRAAVARAAE